MSYFNKPRIVLVDNLKLLLLKDAIYKEDKCQEVKQLIKVKWKVSVLNNFEKQINSYYSMNYSDW